MNKKKYYILNYIALTILLYFAGMHFYLYWTTRNSFHISPLNIATCLTAIPFLLFSFVSNILFIKKPNSGKYLIQSINVFSIFALIFLELNLIDFIEHSSIPRDSAVLRWVEFGIIPGLFVLLAIFINIFLIKKILPKN